METIQHQPVSYGFKLRSLPAASLSLAFAGVYLVTWLDPYYFGEEAVKTLIYVMFLEMFTLPTAAYIQHMVFADMPQKEKILKIAGMVAFISVFIGGYCFATNEWRLLLFFVGLSSIKLFGAFSDPPSKMHDAYIKHILGLSCLSYLVFIFITLLIPVIPKFGITFSLGRSNELVWLFQPWRGIGFGFLYFLSIGLIELYVHPVKEESSHVR